MVKVLKAGFYSTIQDRGRFGQAVFGVPVSGAMDLYSSALANALLGNYKDAAVLEMTMTGAELQFLKSTKIAISGAHMPPKLNGKSISMFKSIDIKPNDILSFGSLVKGFRTYIAVEGGFVTEIVLGSRSMANGLTETFRINTNDTLKINVTVNQVHPKNAKLKFKASILNEELLEAFKGPEFDQLSKTQKDLLFNHEFEVSKHNNRMAYQLQPLFENELNSILTAPVLPGTIQLTPSGQLIVLMRDAQTTGGYPRILQLTEKSIDILSQKSTGSNLKIVLRNF